MATKRRAGNKDSAAVHMAKKRSAKLSAARRQEIARDAAHARWATNGPKIAAVLPIEDIAAELTRDIPREHWDALPEDLIDRLDEYIYGARKR